MADNNVKIETDTIRDLFSRFCKKAYTISGSIMSDDVYLDKCIELWELDYYCETMTIDQNICDSYPSRIVIPIFELGPSGTILENSCPDANVRIKQDCTVVKSYSSTVNSHICKTVQSHTYVENVREHLRKASMARCRDRAPVPVILCKEKYVCRSGTLAVLADIMRKNVIEQFAAVTTKEKQEKDRKYLDLDKARSVDIDLLKVLKISVIMDLMVENKKTKYWVTVSSSEKIDKNDRYSDFRIAVLPYPGCEFYRKFFNNGLQSKGLFYDWDDSVNDAELSVSNKYDIDLDPIPSKVTNDWNKYQHWDIQEMSKNYLKLALLYILDKDSNESGVLVHCISGWDRTPLFISLIRLSLWADGLAHSSLSVKQMLFFTLAYDWYLFGHLLPDRLQSGEFIMCFCFEFLSEIVDDSYSAIDETTKYKSSYSSNFAQSLIEQREFNEELDDTQSPTSSCTSSTSDICIACRQPSVKLKEESEPQWPFGGAVNGDKENDCHLEDMSDIDVTDNKSAEGPPKRSSLRMPLMEQNKPTTPTRRTRRVSGEEVSSEDKRASKGTSRNNFARDSTGRRSKKNSFSESSVRFNSSHESIDYEIPVDCEQEEPLRSVSKPVAVPGARMRHESTSSAVSESWTIVSPPTSLPSPHDYKFGRGLEDSTATITEETTPSSSIDSDQSFIIFDRKDRLLEIRKLFFEFFSDVYKDHKYGPTNDSLKILPKAFKKFL